MATASPLSLPDDLAATAEPGLWRTLLFFGVYALLIAFTVWYLVRKLPRGGTEEEGGQGRADCRDGGESAGALEDKEAPG